MSHRLLLLSLPLFAGCLSPDFVLDPDGDEVRWPYDCDNNDSAIPGDLIPDEEGNYDCDQDDDGVGVSEDCDDLDPTTYPGAPEICDKVDNDCDGQVDEDVQLEAAFWDDDGDGFGDEAVEACPGEPGTASQDGDCDDKDSTVYPEAEEVCGDGTTQDCLKRDGTDADVECPFPKQMSPGDADHVIRREDIDADCCSFDGVAPDGVAAAGVVVGMWGAAGGGAYQIDGWSDVGSVETRLLGDYEKSVQLDAETNFGRTVSIGQFAETERPTHGIVVGFAHGDEYSKSRTDGVVWVEFPDISAKLYSKSACSGEDIGPFESGASIPSMANVGRALGLDGEQLAIVIHGISLVIVPRESYEIYYSYEIKVLGFKDNCETSTDVTLDPYADSFENPNVWALGHIGGSNNDDIGVSGHSGYHCYSDPFERFEPLNEVEVKYMSLTRLDAPEGAPAPPPPVLYGVGQYRPPDLVDEIFDLTCPDGYIVGAIYAGHDDDARLREHDVRIVSEHHMSIDSMAMIDSVLFISNDGGAGSIYQVEFDSTLIMPDGVARMGGSNIFLTDPWLTGHNSGDEFGAAMTTADLNSDGHTDLIVSAPGYDRDLFDLSGLDLWDWFDHDLELGVDEGDPGGAVYIFFADANGEFSQTSLDEADAVFYGHPGQQVGRQLIGLKDMNGDEIDDLLISVEPSANGSPQTIAYILYGGPSTP